MNQKINKIIFVSTFMVVTITSLLMTNYSTSDMLSYAGIYDIASDQDNPVFYFKSDPLFFWFMRLANLVNINFYTFHFSYILITTFLWIVITLNQRIYVTRKVLLLQVVFIISLSFSPYINESFRIFPIILFSGFFLLRTHRVSQRAMTKIKSILIDIIFTAVHWSYSLIIIQRFLLSYKTNKFEFFLFLGILSALAFLVGSVKLVPAYLNYLDLQNRFGTDTTMNYAAVMKVGLIYIFLQSSFKTIHISRNLFLFLLTASIVQGLSLISYTAVARTVDLFFHAIIFRNILGNVSLAPNNYRPHCK